MKSPLELRRRFSFPPKDLEDSRIMKYTEFLEIEVYDDPGSPEIFYAVSIDPWAVKNCPGFIQFINDCGDCETTGGKIKALFKYLHEKDLLLFIVSGEQFLIDKNGYLHLGRANNDSEEGRRFIISALKDYYGFKIYEKE